MRPASPRSGDHPRSSGLHRVRFAVVTGLTVALLAVVWPVAVAAHGGGPALLLEPDRVNPGGVVTVRGEDLGADEPILFRLIGSAGAIVVGEMTADPVGHLSIALRIPPEMAVGVYALEAYQASGARVANAPVFVEGSPIVDGQGGQGGRDEDDPLLIVLPAGWQQSLSSPIVTAVPVTSAGNDQVAGAAEMGLVAGLGLLAVAVGVIGMVLASRLRRRRAPSPEPPPA